MIWLIVAFVLGFLCGLGALAWKIKRNAMDALEGFNELIEEENTSESGE